MFSDLTGSDCARATRALFPANLVLVSDMPLADTPKVMRFRSPHPASRFHLHWSRHWRKRCIISARVRIKEARLWAAASPGQY